MSSDVNKSLPPKIVREQGELTPEQQAYIRQLAQEHHAALLSCKAIDEQEAEAHLRTAYLLAGLEPPIIRWFDSPISFGIAYCSLLPWEDVSGQIGEALWKHTRESLQEARFWLRSRKNDLIRSTWNPDPWYTIWHRVLGGLSSLASPIARSWISRIVLDGGTFCPLSIWEGIWKQVPEEVWESGWQERDISIAEGVAYSIRAYWSRTSSDFTVRVLHELFETTDKIHLVRFNELVSGYRLGNKEAWVVSRPIRLEYDEQGNLHSATGMCLQYRDGWGFYAWHGVGVSERVILHPEQLSKEDWQAESNLEVRRIIAERMPNVVEQLSGQCIDTGTRGSLYEVDLRDDTTFGLASDPEQVAHYVRLHDSSTDRQYYLRVPPTIARADEAVAWTFGLEEWAYQLEQET